MNCQWIGILLVLVFGTCAFADEPVRIPLWNGLAPIGDDAFESAEAWLTLHRPDQGKGKGAAIVICPGGGYGGLVTGPEGHGIAEWLNGHGIAGAVLEYRLPSGRHLVPLLDAQRAIRYLRANSGTLDVSPSRIGIIGFSAGGHLASTAGTHFDDGDSTAANAIERASCRPDAVLLVYPVISMGPLAHSGSRANLLGANPPPELMERYSNEKRVTPRTPPTFLAHAKDDMAVSPEHSRAFHAALERARVPSLYVELPSGGHGLDGYRGPMWDEWQAKAIAWLVARDFASSGD